MNNNIFSESANKYVVANWSDNFINLDLSFVEMCLAVNGKSTYDVTCVRACVHKVLDSLF